MPTHYDRYFNTSLGTFELSSLTVSPDEPVTIEARQVLIGKYQPYKIKKVVVNPEKEATTVLFEDGSHIVVKKHENDPDVDILSIVAYAVAEHIYGSNSAFKRELKNKIEVIGYKKSKSLDEAELKRVLAEMEEKNAKEE